MNKRLRANAIVKATFLILIFMLVTGALPLNFTQVVAETEILVFEDGFEGEIADFWNWIHAPPKFSTDTVHSGSYSFTIDDEEGGLVYSFPSEIDPVTNGTWEFEAWFYDNMSTTARSFGFSTGSIYGGYFGMLMWSGGDFNNFYAYRTGGLGSETLGPIPRTVGWHKVTIIHGEEDAAILIDNAQLYQTNEPVPFNRFFFGDWWADNSICNTFYDDVKVWRSPAPEPTPTPTIPPDPSERTLVYEDGFENYIADFWDQLHSAPKFSNTIVHSGSYSFIIEDEEGGLVHNFPSNVVDEVWEFESWFYDNKTPGKYSFGFATGWDYGMIFGLLMWSGSSDFDNYYAYRYGGLGSEKTSSISRSVGWHRVNIIHGIENAVMYLDGVEMFRTATPLSFNRFFFGDWWLDGSICHTCYDDVKVWKYASNVTPVPFPMPSPTPTPSTIPSPTPSSSESPSPSPTPTTPPITGYYSLQFQWSYQGDQFNMDLDIPKYLYEEYRSVPVLQKVISGPAGYGFLTTTNDPYIKNLAGDLNSSANARGFNEYQTVSFMLAFVQSLPWTSDTVTTGFDEYPRFPIETLVDKGGDCEDTSILFAALVLEMGYGIVYINFPGHMAVGVKGANLPGSYFNFNNQQYYYCETTGEGFAIGQIPSEFTDSKAKIFNVYTSQQYSATIDPDFPPPSPSPSPEPTHTTEPTPTPAASPTPTPTLKPESTGSPETPNPTENPQSTSIKDYDSSASDPNFSMVIIMAIFSAVLLILIIIFRKRSR